MRMLSKIVIAATAVLVAAPALADDANKGRFVHEGYTYVYQVKDTKAGKQISGTRYPGATAFSLNVRGEKVSGQSGGQPVAFKVADAAGAAAGATE